MPQPAGGCCHCSSAKTSTSAANGSLQLIRGKSTVYVIVAKLELLAAAVIAASLSLSGCDKRPPLRLTSVKPERRRKLIVKIDPARRYPIQQMTPRTRPAGKFPLKMETCERLLLERTLGDGIGRSGGAIVGSAREATNSKGIHFTRQRQQMSVGARVGKCPPSQLHPHEESWHGSTKRSLRDQRKSIVINRVAPQRRAGADLAAAGGTRPLAGGGRGHASADRRQE